MDPASSIVEKVVETKNGTQEVDAGVIEMATKNIDNSVESPLESNIGSNVGQSITSTDDNDDADLVIEESESDEHSSDGERTSDVAETEDLIKVAEIDKPSLSSDANSTAEINGSAEIESEDPTVEDSSIKSDPETSVLDSTKADKRSTVSEENPNVEVIDENIVIVSTSDARMANVPQETSKIIIEGDEVKRTEEVALKDCTESLTEKGAKEPTTCELTAENTKNEVFSPIENVNELKELGKNAVENKDVKLFQETQQGREANEITDQSELLNDNIRDREHLRLSNQTDFNNQILDIISDIDINIKAQEKITQLKEQELKLIQKQNELANQIHQQQILAQQLNAKNTIKQSQFQSDKFDSKCQQQNDRDVSTLTLNQNNVISKAIASPPQSTNVPSNPQRELAYTPSVAQGWGGRNVELPKGLYVPKEISLSSYAAPPQQYAGNNEHFESPNNGSVSRPLPRTNFSAFQSTVGNNGTGQFPLSKPLSPGFSTVPPKQQLYSPSSYQRIPIGSENVAPQVSFNPAPLTFDKLARYEQPDRKNSTSTSSQYLNVQQNSQVRNASPTPFGIVLNEHTSGSPSSAGSIGSPYRQLLPTGSPRGGPSIGRPTSPLANKGQIFNQCARGWGAIPDKQQTYQSQFSSPTTGNLPYTDF
ncbi:interaptin isoform X26 [Drosophila suzukii]|uniref:Interaptin isoform X26 n=1 Tax=Drosophila suzukii TaxID=28584 RepID=A0ABM4TTI5_DROSZ